MSSSTFNGSTLSDQETSLLQDGRLDNMPHDVIHEICSRLNRKDVASLFAAKNKNIQAAINTDGALMGETGVTDFRTFMSMTANMLQQLGHTDAGRKAVTKMLYNNKSELGAGEGRKRFEYLQSA